MLCPSCGESLTQENLKGKDVDRCHNCDGIWLDESELSHIIRQIETPAAIQEEQRNGPVSINCPKCDSTMKLTNYAYDSGVWINKCESCSGVWLAHGQLDLIAQYRIGTPAVRSLGNTIGAKFRSSNRLQRLRLILRSRLLSGTFAFIYLVAALLEANIETAFRLAAFMTLPLFCIWFPDGMGNHIGVGLGLAQPAITQKTPGDFVAIGGWLLLLCPLVVIIIT